MDGVPDAPRVTRWQWQSENCPTFFRMRPKSSGNGGGSLPMFFLVSEGSLIFLGARYAHIWKMSSPLKSCANVTYIRNVVAAFGVELGYLFPFRTSLYHTR